MRIFVKFFAHCREAAGQRETELELPAGSDVRGALERLQARYPRLDARCIAAAVNQEYVEQEHVLSEGDELALIPPVSGGGCV